MADVSNSNYKKELKTLEGEKRAALKKAKGTKGKKAKDLVEQVEADFDTKLKALQAKYDIGDGGTNNNNMAAVATEFAVTTAVGATDEATVATVVTTENSSSSTAVSAAAIAGGEDKTEQQLYQRQKKLEKASRKREEARQKQRDIEQALQTAKALPNAKDIELKNMQLPEHGRIHDVIADGHCLYRAVAAQIDNPDYRSVRKMAADSLLQHRDSFEAFCTSQYDDYVDRVRNSADWGGHLELRALSLALQRPIIVYSTGPPLTIGEESMDGSPIRLSYHLHYYALGEHYNQVVVDPVVVDGNAPES